MLSSRMAVSPRETGNLRHCWRGLVCASFIFAALIAAAASAQETRFFRIGTAATGGSFFEVGGLLAGAISGPTEGPPCGRGGSCGVRGLVAVAQATPGSIENLKMINGSQIESGFAQADLAGWAYNGVNLFSTGGPLRKLRAIASLFPVAVHLVIPADSAIGSLKSLRGKRVAVGEAGSGTAAVSAVLLAAAGLREGDLTAKYLRPGPAGAVHGLGPEEDLAAVGVVEAGDQPQQGGLAAAGRAKEREELAGADIKIDRLENVIVAIGQIDRFDPDPGRGRSLGCC